MPQRSTPPPMPPKRPSSFRTPLIAGGAVVLLGFVGVVVLVIGRSSGNRFSDIDSNMPQELRDMRADFDSRTADMRQQINEAHELWESDDRFEAVRRYKALIRSDEFRWDLVEFQPELVTAYRRVIEHEADYGDPGSARDWAVRAYNQGQWSEYASLRKLTFSSEVAATIWDEVSAAHD